MSKLEKFSLFLLRLGLGWIFLYAGVARIRDNEWSMESSLQASRVFPEISAWLASAQALSVVDFFYTWGFVAVGIFLIFGIFVRLASLFGIALMVLLYAQVVEMKAFELFPQFTLPHARESFVLVNDHIIFALALFVLGVFRAGRIWGLEGKVLGDHPRQLASLPPVHQDPFDRLLIAQAMSEKAVVITRDRIFAKYPPPFVKA